MLYGASICLCGPCNDRPQNRLMTRSLDGSIIRYPMAQKTQSQDKLREICRVAARVFYEKGYDGASMQDIADAVGLTKAGLYHHIGSKDHLLYEIMNYGMDILQETVLDKVKTIVDPREKLRQTIIGHIDLIVRARDQEITVILHEN